MFPIGGGDGTDIGLFYQGLRQADALQHASSL